jgi:hypothetical protein
MRRALARIGPVLGLCLLAAHGTATAAEESAASTLEMAQRYADLIRDTIPILDRAPDPPTLAAALNDTRLAVVEIDRLSANAAIFQSAPRERRLLQDVQAGAHLRLALFEAHGLEPERAREELARARSLSDIVESPDFRTEWLALQTGHPGSALLTRFNLLTVADFEAALGSLAYRARPVPFEIRGFTTQDLSLMTLVATTPPPADSLEERLLARGSAALREALDRGQTTFTIPLPPGLYRLQGRPGGDLDRTFVVPEATEVDTVIIDRARFALRLESKPGPKAPALFLNGIRMANLGSLPYGIYRLKADPGEYPDAPQIIRFVLGEGIPDKTRTSWTLYVPGGTSAVLSLDRGGPGTRRR